MPGTMIRTMHEATIMKAWSPRLVPLVQVLGGYQALSVSLRCTRGLPGGDEGGGGA